MDDKNAIIADYIKEEEKRDELALKAEIFCDGQYNPATMVTFYYVNNYINKIGLQFF